MKSLGRRQSRNSRSQLIRQMYKFQAISSIGGTFYGFFYSVFLFRAFHDISYVIFEQLFSSLINWAGLLLGNYLVTKYNYSKVAKLSFFIFSLAAFLTFLLTAQIQQIFLLFSFMRGLAGGLSDSVNKAFLLREVRKKDRNHYFFLNRTLTLGIGIILPIIIGLLINKTAGYRITFLISSLVYFVAVITPFVSPEKSNDKINLKKIREITRLNHFGFFAINSTFRTGIDALNSLLFTLIPFLVLKSEFKMGMLASITSVAAFLFSYLHKNAKFKRQVKFGYVGSFARFILNFMFIIKWSTPFLVIKDIGLNAFSIFTDPVYERMDIEIQRKILGKKIKESALGINIINSTLGLIGLSLALITFWVITTVFKQEQLLIIRAYLILYAIIRTLQFRWTLHFRRKISDSLQQEEAALPVPEASFQTA